MARLLHCDNCNRSMEVGEWALHLSISEFVVPKPGKPRMQYTPGRPDRDPTGLFEVDVDLCKGCTEQPLDFAWLWKKMTGDMQHESLAEHMRNMGKR